MMGITIRSKRFYADMGYGGFMSFRQDLAKCIGPEMHAHYMKLESAPYSGRKEFFVAYDAETTRLQESGIVTNAVAAFLYAPDCEGKADREQAKQISALIQSIPDDTIYGYCARPDCATAKKMKEIFADKTIVRWS